MVAGPTQQSPAFDPVAAGAILRRARVAKIRATTTIESTTTAPQPRGTNGFKVTATFSEKSNGAVRKEDYDRANAPKQDRLAGSPQDWKPMERGFQGASPWKEGDAVRKEDYDRANAPKSDRFAGNPADWKPMERGFQGASPWKEGDAVRKEDYDRANAPKPGTQSRLDGNPENWKKMGGNGFKGSPLPQQLNGPDSNLPVRSREQESADRQMDAANETDDYAAQARARGAARRAAAKKKNASQGDDAPIGTAERGASVLYSVLFQGAAAADQLCEDGGVTATFAGAGNLYQTLLTIFPSFDDKMRNSFGAWLPQKFDIMNTRKQEMLFHFGEFVKGIVAATEMLLYLLMILFIPILLAAIYAFVTNPLLGIQAYLSVF